MAVPAQEAERRVRVLAEGIREGGLRLTHQRLEVARELAASDAHPDVETIFCNVRRRVPTVSLDTVYRTVGTLAELGLIERVSVLTGPARYDADLSEHHHFVCQSCGLIRDIRAGSLDRLEAPAEIGDLGTVEHVKVQFHGTCRDCVEKNGKGDRP